MKLFFSQYFILSLTLTIALLFTLPINTFAEPEKQTVKVEADAILEPLPLRLIPQWWELFAQNRHKKLQEHIDQLTSELNSINTPEEARVLASQVIILLEQYETKRNTPLPIKTSVKNKEKRIYFLDDVFQLIKQTKSTDSDLQLLNTNYKTLLEEIKTADSTLNKLKLGYLKQKETDTDKLIKGLEWIKARVNLSLLELTKKEMSARQKRLGETLQALREERKFAIDELMIKAKEIKDSELFVNLLEGTIESVNKDLLQLKSKERSIVVTDEESKSAKQLLSLKALQISAKLRKLETERLTHLLIGDINTLQKDSLESVREGIRKNQYKSL
ncbi:MAG: hypothetical protein KAG34_04690, partial [Cocleimonas sp.]|nr:hypothetical protein [Cocleimonas sp.]